MSDEFYTYLFYLRICIRNMVYKSQGFLINHRHTEALYNGRKIEIWKKHWTVEVSDLKVR